MSPPLRFPLCVLEVLVQLDHLEDKLLVALNTLVLKASSLQNVVHERKKRFVSLCIPLSLLFLILKFAVFQCHELFIGLLLTS